MPQPHQLTVLILMKKSKSAFQVVKKSYWKPNQTIPYTRLASTTKRETNGWDGWK